MSTEMRAQTKNGSDLSKFIARNHEDILSFTTALLTLMKIVKEKSTKTETETTLLILLN